MLTLAFTPLGVGSITTCGHVKELYSNSDCCGAPEKLLTNVDVEQCTKPADPVNIKSSSLSYANAAGRVGFDFQKFYNDFNNEGHMYPVHGVGDLDKTRGLMANFIKSAQGEPFLITDLDIHIKVTDDALKNNNCFFDFHNIPTKMLDGSAKLPDGSRIESRIPYFTKKAKGSNGPCEATLDWINGTAKFENATKCLGQKQGFHHLNDTAIPTSLASTRKTPFLRDDENLALAFFMDGKQARLTNGGNVSNWRYVVPLGMGRPLSWFVAKAYVECDSDDDMSHCDLVSTTDSTNSNDKIRVRPRTAKETEDPDTIASKPRIMKTVSEAVPINAAPRAAAFNQRYADKCVDFGDVMMRSAPQVVADPSSDDLADQNTIHSIVAAVQDKEAEYKHDKQMQFYEMLRAMKDGGLFDATHIYDTADLHKVVVSIMQWFIDKYLNKDTYNISPKALVSKALLPPSYMWSPVCETGWLVVEEEKELKVPEDGEYFIGWTVETQPMFESEAHDSIIRTSTVSPEKLQQLVTKGYTLHNGPGMIFQTCGDFAHHGNQAPFLLEHNYEAKKQHDETLDAFKSRKKSQLPTVHWRLDTKDVIKKSLMSGQFTKANVGAGQSMLASIGTKTHKSIMSRSKNFLGEKFQDMLANKTKIAEFCSDYKGGDHVYECSTDDGKPLYLYGVLQQGSPALPPPSPPASSPSATLSSPSSASSPSATLSSPPSSSPYSYGRKA